jgi:hypothetical protein
MLDTERDARAEYHDKLTVAKTFALAIEEAAKLHPAAQPLIVRAALLAPEPIPLFIFAEGREEFGDLDRDDSAAPPRARGRRASLPCRAGHVRRKRGVISTLHAG